jgi:hypothetical protein
MNQETSSEDISLTRCLSYYIKSAGGMLAMVNVDTGKVAKLSHQHKSTYPGNKHKEQNAPYAKETMEKDYELDGPTLKEE